MNTRSLLLALALGGAGIAGCADTREQGGPGEGEAPPPGPQMGQAPANQQVAQAEPGTQPTAGQAATVYNQNCAACHGGQGEGITGLAPPLRGNAFVTEGNRDAIVETIHKGRVGPAKRYPQEYPAAMPAFPQITGEQLDQLIQYMQTQLQG